MKKILMLGIIMIAFVSCGSSYHSSNYEQNKDLDEMIANKAFQIESNWAEPQVNSAMQQLTNVGLYPPGSTPGNIDISSHANFFKMENDSVKAYLPFYGERQFGGGYSSNVGIVFEDIPKDLHIAKGKKSGYEIRFNINDTKSNSENYQVYIKLFSNLASTIIINSTQRTTIQYRGKVSRFDSETY